MQPRCDYFIQSTSILTLRDQGAIISLKAHPSSHYATKALLSNSKHTLCNIYFFCTIIYPSFTFCAMINIKAPSFWSHIIYGAIIQLKTHSLQLVHLSHHDLHQSTSMFKPMQPVAPLSTQNTLIATHTLCMPSCS